jgi:catechol 2,3-dioxygenase-like lactoylglutathione lyase family enzyme
MGYEFHHVHLKAPHPGKTAEWYATAFDFTIVSDIVRPNGDQFVVTRTPDGVTVNISGPRAGEELDEGNADVHWGLEHIGITIDDLDAELERLTSMGAVLKEGPIDVPDGPRIAFIAGPDDTRIELLQLPG